MWEPFQEGTAGAKGQALREWDWDGRSGTETGTQGGGTANRGVGRARSWGRGRQGRAGEPQAPGHQVLR